MPYPLFYDFVTAINQHDAPQLGALMTEDHLFTDARGKDIRGNKTASEAWAGYFRLFPDYAIELTDVWEKGPEVMAMGFASGSHAQGQGWRIPAAWKMGIKAEKVSHWQVFADTKIAYDSIHQRLEQNSDDDAGKRVTSMGGVFFKCKDPEKMKTWYSRHLGLKTDVYGTSFAWRQAPDGQKKGFTAWSPFPDDTAYFAPSIKPFMFNYRVADLQRLIEQLKEEGVTILDDIQTYPYGKFVHILDPEYNKIELWEADDEAYADVLGAVTF